ncbi:MAG: hypothetical protein RI922_2225 [Bacteroidota bacterium]|jgi:hypothetical protein
MNFKGRKLVIATMHNKEKAMAPILEKRLGVQCCLEKKLDTDQFGTFSGEIERSKSPLEVLRAKCLAAMELSGCDIAIASEGSFGNHPLLFFSQANDELVMFLDRKNNIEIVERELSLSTNLAGRYIHSLEELDEFAEKVLFPSHALIVKDKESDFSFLEKGIQSIEKLQWAFNTCWEKHASVYVETDMRAMYNPTRMKNIALATSKLCDKIASCCPRCYFPGFSVEQVVPGLPCSSCRFPTKSTKAILYKCKKCSFEEKHNFPHKKYEEDPTYCDICNP